VAGKKAPIREKDLQQWKTLEVFRQALRTQMQARGGSPGSWQDERRKLSLEGYLSLFLFGLFNPVVKTMRGLCAASDLPRVRQEVLAGAAKVSLGSFSEAQALVDVELLEAVFGHLQESARPDGPKLCGLTGRELVIDSTLWPALPRMAWAFWRGRAGSQAGPDNAVRLHVEFDLMRGHVSRAQMTPAKCCERAQWRQWAKLGACYIGDRYYSYDFQTLAGMQQAGVDFVVRLRIDTQWVEQSSQLLSQEDRQAGVRWAGMVRLGARGDGPCLRVIQLLGEDESILIATTLPPGQAAAALIALLYRHRWQVEMFFRWLKCILGSRRWLAESSQGVAVQCYLALIAAQLLVLFTGSRPNRRQMEAIQFYLMDWADAADTAAQLARYATKRKKP
jgi:hypothetical protein